MPNITRATEDLELPKVRNATASRVRLRRALQKGFGIQYWGDTFTASELSVAPHGLLIVEATRSVSDLDGQVREILFHPNEIHEIRKRGKRLALGYLNLTEIEPYRDFWKERSAVIASPDELYSEPWIGPVTSQGERLACYWREEWIAILEARVDRLLSLGLDGIFLDDVLHYYSYLYGDTLVWPSGKAHLAKAQSQNFATSMLDLIVRLSKRIRMHQPGSVVVVNNGVFLEGDVAAEIGDSKAAAKFSSYAKSIDGILVESAFGPGTKPAVHTVMAEQFKNRGVSVLTVDFETQFPDVSPEIARLEVRQRATARGFSTYIAENNLFNALYPPCAGQATRKPR